MTDGCRRSSEHLAREGGRVGAALGASLGAVVVLAVTLSSCSSPVTTASSPPDTVPSIPLASSSAAPGASWATLAMGHLDDPVNTFWQVLSLAKGSDRWDLATPPGVASNGGLAVSVAGGSSLAGFLPSQRLHFSPLAESTDGGSTWAPGLLPAPLAPVPDSLSFSAGGHPLALVQAGGGTVVTSAGGLTEWKPLVSKRMLATDPSTSSCGIEKLTALAGGGAGSPLVGAVCVHETRAGIFESVGRGWNPVGPVLPGAPAGPTQVIRLEGIPNGAAALVSTGTGAGVELFALWSTDGLRTWTVSSGLPLGRGVLTATGTTPSGGFVVTTGADGRPGASEIDRSTPAWHGLAPPPAGTTSVVTTPTNAIDALVVSQSVLDVYTLGAGGWDRTQVLNVPIQYGSSG